MFLSFFFFFKRAEGLDTTTAAGYCPRPQRPGPVQPGRVPSPLLPAGIPGSAPLLNVSLPKDFFLVHSSFILYISGVYYFYIFFPLYVGFFFFMFSFFSSFLISILPISSFQIFLVFIVAFSYLRL